LNLPMPVRQVLATDSVKADRNKVAIQRGPLMYCVEQLANADPKQNFIIPDNATFKTEFEPNLLNGVTVIKADVSVIKPTADGKSLQTQNGSITAIPYYSWANRGRSQMEVWLPTKVSSVNIKANSDDN